MLCMNFSGLLPDKEDALFSVQPLCLSVSVVQYGVGKTTTETHTTQPPFTADSR